MECPFIRKGACVFYLDLVSRRTIAGVITKRRTRQFKIRTKLYRSVHIEMRVDEHEKARDLGLPDYFGTSQLGAFTRRKPEQVIGVSF